MSDTPRTDYLESPEFARQLDELIELATKAGELSGRDNAWALDADADVLAARGRFVDAIRRGLLGARPTTPPLTMDSWCGVK